MKIRAAVLEHTGGRQLVQELDLAPPGPGEVLVRLGASGVCRSDYNAIDGTTESPCPVVLGHEGAGVVEAVGAGVTRVAPGDHVALSWTPSCGECSECVRDLPQLCATIWPVMNDAGPDGRHEPALARRRARLPLLLPLDLRRGVRRSRALVRPDPGRRAVRRCGARRLRGDDRRRRRLEDGRRSAGRPRRRDRLRRRRPLRPDGSGGGRRRAGDRRRHDADQGRCREGVRRVGRRRLGRKRRGDRGGRSRGQRWRRRLRDRGDRPRRGDAGGRPLDPQSRRRRPDRDPARGHDAERAGAHDPADGAADPRLDLRLGAARSATS